VSRRREPTPPGGALIRPFLTDPGAGPGPSPGPAGDGRGGPAPPPPPEPSEHPERPDGVRPFLVTAGRTAPSTAYPVETQVMITEGGQEASRDLSFEYGDIVDLCTEPLAVAELAARLHLHLGVIRVLVDDLVQRGVVTTFPPRTAPGDDVTTIQRVIDALQRRS